jgi:hypothetical protein
MMKHLDVTFCSIHEVERKLKSSFSLTRFPFIDPLGSKTEIINEGFQETKQNKPKQNIGF